MAWRLTRGYGLVLMLGSSVTHSLKFAAGWLLGLIFLMPTTFLVWRLVKEAWEKQRVLQDGSFEQSDVPDPRPKVLHRWTGSTALATTSGRRIYVLRTLAREPNGANEFGDPFYDSFVVALTKVVGSFPPQTMEKYSRGFAAMDGWAVCYEEEPASIFKVAGDLDEIVSSIEHQLS